MTTTQNGFESTEDYKIVAEAVRTYSCGTVAYAHVARERGSWYLWTADYSIRHTTKKAALAALEAWKVD